MATSSEAVAPFIQNNWCLSYITGFIRKYVVSALTELKLLYKGINITVIKRNKGLVHGDFLVSTQSWKLQKEACQNCHVFVCGAEMRMYFSGVE